MAEGVSARVSNQSFGGGGSTGTRTEEKSTMIEGKSTVPQGHPPRTVHQSARTVECDHELRSERESFAAALADAAAAGQWALASRVLARLEALDEVAEAGVIDLAKRRSKG